MNTKVSIPISVAYPGQDGSPTLPSCIFPFTIFTSGTDMLGQHPASTLAYL